MIKTPATKKWIENVNYQLIPDEDANFWKVRILEGDFIETVFQYGTVKFDEKNLLVEFTYDIMYSPDEDILSRKKEFEKTASEILNSIMIGLLDDDRS